MTELDQLKAALKAKGLKLSELKGSWELTAREAQRPPPGNWRTWLFLAGRGAGKTAAAAHFVHDEWVKAKAKAKKLRVHLVGATSNDVFNTMLGGISGLCSILPPDSEGRTWPQVNGQRMTFSWPDGSGGQYFSSDAASRLRGPQCDLAWCDELSSFENLLETWTNLQFGLRLGDNPRCVVTTTPKPLQFLRDLSKMATTVVTTGSSYDNRENLAESFFTDILSKYEGSRIGDQEILGKILDDLAGALFNAGWFQHKHIEREQLKKVVVSVDPGGGTGRLNNLTGIVVVGLGFDGFGYVLKDLSGKFTPDAWGRIAVAAYDEYKAERIIVERNYGADMAEHVLRSVRPNVAILGVSARVGKILRAAPVSSLYEQRKIFHYADEEEEGFQGTETQKTKFRELEAQMITYQDGDASPDRLDALVHGLTYLMLTDAPSARGMGENRLGFW